MLLFAVLPFHSGRWPWNEGRHKFREEKVAEVTGKKNKMTKEEYEEWTELGYLLIEKLATNGQRERFNFLWKRLSLARRPDDASAEANLLLRS
jgi:hypothetical protein